MNRQIVSKLFVCFVSLILPVTAFAQTQLANLYNDRGFTKQQMGVLDGAIADY